MGIIDVFEPVAAINQRCVSEHEIQSGASISHYSERL